MVKLRVVLSHQTWPPLADKDLEQILVRASGETKKKEAFPFPYCRRSSLPLS